MDARDIFKIDIDGYEFIYHYFQKNNIIIFKFPEKISSRSINNIYYKIKYEITKSNFPINKKEKFEKARYFLYDEQKNYTDNYFLFEINEIFPDITGIEQADRMKFNNFDQIGVTLGIEEKDFKNFL